jgi:hypothetical protein
MESEGSWRQKSAPTNRNYIQGGLLRVMLQNKQKPNYCAEHQDVNVEVTWTESGYTYPERSGAKLMEILASIKVETHVRIRITLW